MHVRGDRSQKIDSWLDCFYKIELLPGTNIISFSYIPKGLIGGILISVLTGVALNIYILLTNSKKK